MGNATGLKVSILALLLLSSFSSEGRVNYPGIARGIEGNDLLVKKDAKGTLDGDDGEDVVTGEGIYSQHCLSQRKARSHSNYSQWFLSCEGQACFRYRICLNRAQSSTDLVFCRSLLHELSGCPTEPLEEELGNWSD